MKEVEEIQQNPSNVLNVDLPIDHQRGDGGGAGTTMLLLSTVLPIVSLARRVAASPTDSFRESLTLHPLPDGKLSVLFEFTTDFTSVSHRSSTIRMSAFSYF